MIVKDPGRYGVAVATRSFVIMEESARVRGAATAALPAVRLDPFDSCDAGPASERRCPGSVEETWQAVDRYCV